MHGPRPSPSDRLAASPASLSRRGFLAWSAAVTLAACAEPVAPTAPPTASARPAESPPPTSSRSSPESRPPSEASSQPTSSPGRPSGSAGRRILFRDAAIADGRSERLRLGVSVLVENMRIAWIRPTDDEPDPGPRAGHEVVDASGATIVPGMVDAHSHVTMPGGAHWIDRAFDDPADLLLAAEQNGRLLTRAGVRWARDVGAPVGEDPNDGRKRALSLGVRDRWAASAAVDRPYIRAAGTWLTRRGTLPTGLGVEANDGDELLAAATRQLDDGADLVKLYLDGPDPGTSPWSANEIRSVVGAAHERGAKVTAHSGRLSGARAGVAGGVDALEHGFELDAAVARDMAKRGTALISTLSVMRSWKTFAKTTTLPRFAEAEGRRAIAARLERAEESIALAHKAKVAIAAGTDFGGGSGRANQLAWEVEALVAAGLEPWEALGAATWRGGDLLGEAEAGVIRDGGPADFLLVHGDPTSDPTALWRVWRVVWAD
jgi:imidazolonepropionase-like amidohydrolase